MNDREKWRERGSEISVLVARHDDYDDEDDDDDDENKCCQEEGS